MLTDDDIAQYERDGYLMKPQFFDSEESRILLTEAKQDAELDKNMLYVEETLMVASPS